MVILNPVPFQPVKIFKMNSLPLSFIKKGFLFISPIQLLVIRISPFSFANV